MTQEDIQLLLKDLCARLPYKVKIQSRYGEIITSDLNTFPVSMEEMDEEDMWDQLSGFKPYLRPMSSMTEEERKEFQSTQYEEVVNQYPCSAAPNEIKILSYTAKTFDWLNAHHFDYRGLIPMGLALKATEGMYSV